MLEVPGDSDFSGQLIPSWLKKTSTVPILPMEVAKASFEQISAVVLSQAYSDPMVAAVVTLSSQVVSDDGGEEIVGSWVFWYWYWGGPSLLPRNSGMVEDLDKSWVFRSGFFFSFFFLGRTHCHTHQLLTFEQKHKITSLLFLFFGSVIFGF